MGVGGSGKQSLARLAAFAAGCAVFEIQLARGYGRTAFLEDLKALYTMLGDNKRVRFACKVDVLHFPGFFVEEVVVLPITPHREPLAVRGMYQI